MDMISIVLPTRNRPENLHRMYQSIKDTAREMPEFALYIDEDDKLSEPVADELGMKRIIGPRQLLAKCWNDALSIATNDILMYIDDDRIFREKDWDVKVLAEFNKSDDKFILVHGNDGYYGSSLCTHGFLHRRWVETVGYLMPPYFATWYMDNWQTDVADGVGRRVYLDFVLAEHMHHEYGKAQADTTYAEANPRRAKDGCVWADTESVRLADIVRLKKAIHEHQFNGTRLDAV